MIQIKDLIKIKTTANIEWKYSKDNKTTPHGVWIASGFINDNIIAIKMEEGSDAICIVPAKDVIKVGEWNPKIKFSEKLDGYKKTNG